MLDFPYARYGELLGFKGLRIHRPDEVADAWQQAFEADRPVVLEFVTDPSVPPLPPHISFEQARAFLGAIASGDPNRWDMLKQGARTAAALARASQARQGPPRRITSAALQRLGYEHAVARARPFRSAAAAPAAALSNLLAAGLSTSRC